MESESVLLAVLCGGNVVLWSWRRLTAAVPSLASQVSLSLSLQSAVVQSSVTGLAWLWLC